MKEHDFYIHRNKVSNKSYINNTSKNLNNLVEKSAKCLNIRQIFSITCKVIQCYNLWDKSNITEQEKFTEKNKTTNTPLKWKYILGVKKWELKF